MAATLGLAIKAEKLGKESAYNNIKNPEKNFRLHNIYLSNGSSVEGYTLTCSNYGCVVYKNKKMQIIPLEKIESIDGLINQSSH